jgi:hypothetical protein
MGVIPSLEGFTQGEFDTRPQLLGLIGTSTTHDAGPVFLGPSIGRDADGVGSHRLEEISCDLMHVLLLVQFWVMMFIERKVIHSHPCGTGVGRSWDSCFPRLGRYVLSIFQHADDALLQLVEIDIAGMETPITVLTTTVFVLFLGSCE